jgi:hypothetical protein
MQHTRDWVGLKGWVRCYPHREAIVASSVNVRLLFIRRLKMSTHRSTLRAVVAFITILALTWATLPAGAAPSQQAALPTWPTNPNWQALVPAPTSTNVKAGAINRTQGTVTNAAALLSSGTATLTKSGSTNPVIVLDFGREVGGTPTITVSSTSSATIRISTSEALTFLTNSSGAFQNDSGGSQINFSLNGARTYTGTTRGGFRFMAIELTTTGTVSLTAAGVNFQAYLGTPAQYQGWFMSSDDQLNRMWYAGAYTAHMDMIPAGVAPCFSVPVIFDGAKRDRAIWSGDLMVSDPAAWFSVGTNSAPYIRGSINSIMNLQASSGRLTSAVGFRGCGAFDYAVTYSAYSAIIATQYYRYSGDTSFITPLLSRLRNAVAYHATRLDSNGLIVTNDPDYWQTSQSGEVTEYSLAYYELLQNMIWLESRIGSSANVTDYTNRANALKNAINSRLFNTSAGLYVRSNTDTARFPLDANMNAIRLGVAPPERVAGILSYFRARWTAHGSEITQPSPSMSDPYGHTIEPLNNTWEAMARMHADDAAGALELMRRLWGLQVDPNSGFYTGTFWEFVMSDGLPDRGFDSLAHAWGAGPTQVLTESVLGVTPVNQGYSTWQVKPHPGSLTWAQGQVPTGSGSLIVRWAADSMGQFHLQVVAPSGTGGQVWVPIASSSASTSVISGSATFVQRSGLYDIYQAGAGTVEFGSVPGGGPTNTPTRTATRTPTGPTSTPTQTPVGGIVWTLCADEGGTCTFSGTMTVRYGANNSWFYRVATNSIACTNAVFGDPIQGTVKSCYYSPNGPTPTPSGPTSTPTRTNTPGGPTNTPTATPSDIVWTLCAEEGGTCTFSGTMTVRYGAGTSWFYRVATNSIACTNAVFGDPIQGTVKSCYYSPNGPTPTPTP